MKILDLKTCRFVCLSLLITFLGSCRAGEWEEDDDADVSRPELPGHMQPLGSHRPMEGDIERLEVAPDPVTFYEEYVQLRRPVILTRAVADTWVLDAWTDEYLSENFGEEEVAAESRKKEDRQAVPYAMTFNEFLQRYETEDIYLVHDASAKMRGEVFFPGSIGCGGYLQNVLHFLMWFSSGGTKSVLHTDTAHNMHCLVAGEKRFVMIPPEFAEVIGPEWKQQGYYNLDVEAVNMTAYPSMVDVPWYRAVLQPGDCMFLPYNWIHNVNSYDRNLGLNLWFFPFPLNYTDCPEDRTGVNVVSMKDAKPMDHVDTVLQFYKFGRHDVFSRADLKALVDLDYASEELPFSANYLTPSLLNKIFETLHPGSRGKLRVSQLQDVTLEKWGEVEKMMKDSENEYLLKMVEELEQKGLPIPDSLEVAVEENVESGKYGDDPEDSWNDSDDKVDAEGKIDTVEKNDAQQFKDDDNMNAQPHQEL